MGTWGNWTLGDAITFIALIVFIRIAVIWLVTQVFIAIIPDGDKCPICDGETLAIQRNGWWRVLGKAYRRSWCLECGWEGVLRRKAMRFFGFSHADADEAMTKNRSQSGQLPLISKKSSKYTRPASSSD